MTTALTGLFAAAERGDASATDGLFAALYSELHRIARRELARQSGALSLGPTTVLHEAYLDMAAREGTTFPDRARFMGYAARAMRGLIIDHVRSRQALKRGAGFELTSMRTGEAGVLPDERELERVSEALDELAAIEPDLVEIVDLKFFCGFTLAEVAAMRQVSERTVQRQWQKARVFLYQRLRGSEPGPALDGGLA